jgi:cupin superfamily acireductone dioxygenase involved in methionine salvage
MTVLIIDNNIPHTVEMSYEELQKAIRFYTKERERWRVKNQERRKPPTGRPVGRPKKNPSQSLPV